MKSNILDVAIGIIFIFTLYSLLVTIINEIIATLLSMRARVLARAIERMLEKESPHFWQYYFGVKAKRFFRSAGNAIHNILPFIKKFSSKGANLTFYDEFYQSPVIKYLGESKIFKRPSYISAATFSKTLIDLLKEKGAALNNGVASPVTANDIRAALEHGAGNIADETRQLLISLLNDANNDVDKFKALAENWFNEMMDRASGWYKRKTKWITFGLGLIVAIAFNVNTLKILSKLGSDSDAATQLAGLAKTYVEANKSNTYFVKTTVVTSPGSNGKDSTHTVNDTIRPDTASQRKVNELLKRAQTLIDTNVTSVNNLIGLGWKFDTLKLNAAADKAWFPRIARVCSAWSQIREQTSGRDWLGFFITALAISLGAPFWFDLLSKLVQLRSSGADTEKKQQTTAKTPDNTAQPIVRKG